MPDKDLFTLLGTGQKSPCADYEPLFMNATMSQFFMLLCSVVLVTVIETFIILSYQSQIDALQKTIQEQKVLIETTTKPTNVADQVMQKFQEIERQKEQDRIKLQEEQDKKYIQVPPKKGFRKTDAIKQEPYAGGSLFN